MNHREDLKRNGLIEQNQKDYFAIRIKTIAGCLTSEDLRIISILAQKYADAQIHLTTRQGLEIHNIHRSNLEALVKELVAQGISFGANGPKVRGVVACPGAATCKFGIIDTKELAKELDKLYFGKDAPGKFKLAVSGCPNDCSKPIENDIGVMGGVLPRWNRTKCIDCRVCEKVCPADAILRTENGYELLPDKCILCGLCINKCPVLAWEVEKKGYTLWLGGTMGKKPRLGTKVKVLIETKDELLKYIKRAFEFYKKYGEKKERFGHTLDRVGLKKALKEILEKED